MPFVYLTSLCVCVLNAFAHCPVSWYGYKVETEEIQFLI